MKQSESHSVKLMANLFMFCCDKQFPALPDALLQLSADTGDVSTVIAITPGNDLAVLQLRQENGTVAPDLSDTLLQLPLDTGDVSTVIAITPGNDLAVLQLRQ